MQRQICGKKTVASVRELLLDAVEAIKAFDFANAKKLLKEASSLDMENPALYNLLGILYEREGDFIKASKFYRVAYYMDQTFRAPSDNLERVCSFFSYKSQNINWGLERITGGENI